jgi:type VI secretion system protein VasD
MDHKPTVLRLLPALAACLALGACATSRNTESVPLRTWLSASKDVNPDASGRPSPVVVKVFGLRTDSEFNGAEFFALYEREKETLAATLLASQEYVLQPGETKDLQVQLPRDTRYVGVVAAYRDIRSARWRALARAPRKTFGDNFSRDRITIAANRVAVTLAVKD